MPAPIYLPQQPGFMDQFLKTGALENILQSIMISAQNRRRNEEKIQGLQKEGYTEADYTAPTPQEAQAGYRGQAPGQYQGQTYDKSNQVGVAGRQFQPPKETFGIEKGTGKKDWAVVRRGNKLGFCQFD